MKLYRPSTPRPRKLALRIPPFHAVPVRLRADGWTPVRQAEFIGHLAATRSVSAAARAVSMGRESAYRLRARAGAAGFAAAWDVCLARGGLQAGGSQAGMARAVEAARTALRPARKVTIQQLEWRIETGIWTVLLRGGCYVGARRKPDNSALLALLSRTRYASDGDEQWD